MLMPEFQALCYDQLAIYADTPFFVRLVKLKGVAFVGDVLHIDIQDEAGSFYITDATLLHPFRGSVTDAFEAAKRELEREAIEHAEAQGYDLTSSSSSLFQHYMDDIRDGSCALNAPGKPYHQGMPFPMRFVVWAQWWLNLLSADGVERDPWAYDETEVSESVPHEWRLVVELAAKVRG